MFGGSRPIKKAANSYLLISNKNKAALVVVSLFLYRARSHKLEIRCFYLARLSPQDNFPHGAHSRYKFGHANIQKRI